MTTKEELKVVAIVLLTLYVQQPFDWLKFVSLMLVDAV